VIQKKGGHGKEKPMQRDEGSSCACQLIWDGFERYYNIKLMWKSQTILMDQLYPFGAVADPTQKHLVRKKLNKAEGQLEKTKILASLKHECLIKLEGLQE
jgi:hypothetical protein